MRKLLAGMQISLDGNITGPDGYADWVKEWSDHYDVTRRVDACLLGATMYPGYEAYWSAIQSAPDQPTPMTNQLPTPAEVEYAGFTAKTSHYVLSSSLSAANWSNTRFIRTVDDVAALKQRPGKDIYLVGGAQIARTLLQAGLVDELTLAVHPLLSGRGTALFANSERRHALELRSIRKLDTGVVYLTYGLG